MQGEHVALGEGDAAAPLRSALAPAGAAAIGYGQCWEDADVLLEGLDVRPGDACLSIASAGDNTLALLARAPGRVVAVDLNAAQLACLELRVAAYRALDHAGLLELIGSAPSARRDDLYRRCRPLLSAEARRFWDARPDAVAAGIGAAGKFERYLALFRRRVLPLVHGRGTVAALLRPRDAEGRARFYRERWDTWRWRALFRLFFSRPVMARAGRDPRFFQYVQGDVAGRILARARYALTALDPGANPYLTWILTGRHGDALPYALRPEHFAAIRDHLDRLEWHRVSLEEYLAGTGRAAFDRFNLSDVFEYVAPDHAERLLARLADAGRPGARLAYWNLLVPRRRPASLVARLRPLDALAERLHARDRAFFYSAFVLEEVQ
jgi:S-adenosylmethionine-diacylglycerol 3-amino-3-carboxypropyl transferase